MYAHVAYLQSNIYPTKITRWLLSNTMCRHDVLLHVVSFSACLCVSLHVLPNFFASSITTKVVLQIEYKGLTKQKQPYSLPNSVNLQPKELRKRQESHHLFWQVNYVLASSKKKSSASYDGPKGVCA